MSWGLYAQLWELRAENNELKDEIRLLKDCLRYLHPEPEKFVEERRERGRQERGSDSGQPA